MATSRPTTSAPRVIPAITDKSCAHLPSPKTFVVCVSCKEESVCLKCVGSTHVQHTIIDMEDFLDFRKDMLSGLVQEADQQLNDMNDRLSRVQHIQQRNINMVEGVIKDMKARAEMLKKEIDSITDEFVRQCRVTEWNNKNKLSKVEEKLQVDLKDLNKSVSRCKNVLGSTRYSNFKVLEVDLKNQMNCTMDKLPILQILGLDIAKQISPPSQLKGIFGSLIIDDWKFEPSEIPEFLNQKPPSSALTRLTGKDIEWPLRKKQLGSFRHSDVAKIHAVCPVEEIGAWVVGGGTNEASFTSITGDVKRAVKAKMVPKTKTRVVINDVMCTVDTRKTIMCCTDKSIRHVLPNGQCGIMFRADSYVSSIAESCDAACIMLCNDNDGKITQFTEIGECMQTIERDADGRKVMVCPYKVRVNTDNGDIAVIEHAGPRHIIIMDRGHNVIAKYYGESKNTDVATISNQSSQIEFDPRDIAFCEDSNIAVADYGSRSAILIDRNGTLLRTIWRDDNRPTSLGVPRIMSDEFITWIGFDDGSVRVIRHLAFNEKSEIFSLRIKSSTVSGSNA